MRFDDLHAYASVLLCVVSDTPHLSGILYGILSAHLILSFLNIKIYLNCTVLKIFFFSGNYCFVCFYILIECCLNRHHLHCILVGDRVCVFHMDSYKQIKESKR